ncbi:DUF1361 domain-containing protein [Cellulomonas sp. HZM]|uniref:DUF1361 domain-containing protein n=1 Tax=Cellulomonas sp. HZM TaxID=1454010 RepID=UPI00068B5EDE|nr:DUF1361 domain-containing protein [Cellulomonas sp. HZM]
MIASLVLGVVAMNLLAIALVVARGPVFRTRVYRPMLLNLGLSAAPFVVLVIGVGAVAVARIVAGPWGEGVVAVLVVLAWLLLLPNAGYLVTELNLSHRQEGEHVPMWFDVVLVISLAMSGVLNTVLNVLVAQIEWVLLRHGDTAASMRSWDTVLLTVLVLVLVAFGMYLGRSVRLNSWDVRHPTSLVRKVVRHLRAPGALGNAAGFTFLYALFLGIMYIVVAGPVVQAVIELEDLRA